MFRKIIFFLIFINLNCLAWATNVTEQAEQFFNILHSYHNKINSNKDNKTQIVLSQINDNYHALAIYYALKTPELDNNYTPSLSEMNEQLKNPLQLLLYSEYLTSLEDAYKTSPDSALLRAMLDLDELVRANPNYTHEQIKQLEKIADNYPNHNFIQYLYADMLIQNKQPFKAAQILTKINQINPRLLYSKALASLSLDKPALALSDIEQAIKLNKDVPEFYLAKGKILQIMKNSDFCESYRQACVLGICNDYLANCKSN